jgi:hypothetical protein
MRGSGEFASGPRAGIVAALVLVLGPLGAARAAEPTPSIGSRFYAGLNLASLKFDDRAEDVAFSDSSLGLGLYTGYRINDRLAVELSYDRFDAIDLHDLAGSGTVRFDVTSERRTLALSVVRQVSLRDLFDLRRDWRLFGMLGIYDSRVDRTLTLLDSGAEASSADQVTGALAGGGVLYGFGRVELRGYLRWWGDAQEIGAAAQLRF